MRLDVEKLEHISHEAKLLTSNKIETYEQFLLYMDSTLKKLDSLQNDRSNLWYQHKKVKSQIEKNKVRSQIDEKSKMIAELKMVMKLCRGIETRLTQIESDLEEIELEDNGKER